MLWILLERKDADGEFEVVGSTVHEELACEFTEFDENLNRMVVPSE